MIIYIVTVAAYDITGASAETLYFSTKGFSSLPTDTPANTFFDERLKAPASIARNMFSQGRTFGPSQVGLGEVILANGDGALDYLSDYAFDGRVITQYRGEEGSAFPGGYTKQLVATMNQVVLNRKEVSITLRDRQHEVDVPIQSTLYAGNNVLPAGLEGSTDLKGKPKPFLLGKVTNIAAPLVNSAKLIYQPNSGAINSVDAVYDRGIQLGRDLGALTSHSSPFSAGSLTIHQLAYSESLTRYIAVGGSSKIATSDDDGATWTERTGHTFTAGSIKTVVWSPDDSLFVAAGDGGELETSPDGITWTSRTANFSTSSIHHAAYGDGNYVIVGVGGKCCSSTDGITWTARSPGHGSDQIESVAYGPLAIRGGTNTFVIVGAAGKISYSTNGGVSWTNVSSPGFGLGQIIIVRWLGDLFVACLPGETRSSRDGKIWTNWAVTLTDGEDIRDFGYASGLYITVGTAGLIAQGLSSTILTKLTHPSPSRLTMSVIVRDQIIMLAGGGGAIYTSTPTDSVVVYASEAALLLDANAPPPGSYGYYLAGGYIRLGSTPAGLITMDITQGAAASDRTTGQIFTDVLVKVGQTSADWVAGDITTLDSAIDDVVGYWSGTAEDKASRILNVLAEAIGWWGLNSLGKFRIAELKNPSGETSVLDIVKADMVRPLRRKPSSDPGLGIPSHTTRIRYDRNYTVQKEDLASVGDLRRGELAQEWKEESDVNAAVTTAHLLAREAIYYTYLSESADANTAAARVQALRGTRRDIFDFSISYNGDTASLDLGSVIKITHDRFGLASGKKFVIISYELNPIGNAINIGAWG